MLRVPAPMPSKPETDAEVLFCPFCRECYEGTKVCPEHELALVPFQELPRQAHERALRWDEPVPPWEPRFGRLELVIGATLALVGFFGPPLMSGRFDDAPVAWTALQLATSRAPNLWTVPFAALLFGMFLYRRRTPLEMRGARLAGVVLAVMPAVSLGYSLWNVQRAVEGMHGALALSFDVGAWCIGAASVFLLIGSLRFGALGSDAQPHGAAPDPDEARIETKRER